MRGRGGQISPTVEVSRKTKVQRGAPEQQMPAYQPGNNNKEGLLSKMPLNRKI